MEHIKVYCQLKSMKYTNTLKCSFHTTDTARNGKEWCCLMSFFFMLGAPKGSDPYTVPGMKGDIFVLFSSTRMASSR